MKTASPFHLVSESGILSVDRYHSSFLPGLGITEFHKFDLFPSARKVPVFPGTDKAFSIGPIKVNDETWFYINVGFSRGVLIIIGIGWGKLRHGFYELTAPEFAEQLQSYKAWLEAEIGPSMPSEEPVVYRNQLPWGRVEASSDARTKLPGISIRFHGCAE